MKKPSPYEIQAIKAIHAWKNPELGWFGQAMRVINWPLDKAGDAVMNLPGIGEAIRRTLQGIVSVANDAAQYTVRPDAIYAAFREAGHQVHDRDEIPSLDLEKVDHVLAWLDVKYKGAAFVEGAVTGTAGALGMLVDIPALVTLNLRAIGEYATYCGFDISSQPERLFALNILGLASCPADGAKAAAMAQLVRIAQDIARKKAWRELERHAFVQVVQRIASELSIRLTKAVLAHVIPIAGATVGGGFNAYYTSKVCAAAFNLYRERLLAEKYGPDIIEQTVKPATDLELQGAYPFLRQRDRGSGSGRVEIVFEENHTYEEAQAFAAQKINEMGLAAVRRLDGPSSWLWDVHGRGGTFVFGYDDFPCETTLWAIDADSDEAVERLFDGLRR